MAQTIKNFLVGVGLETKDFDTGSAKVITDLGRVRTAAGIAGTALLAAFTTAGAAAIGAGQRIDRFNLATERMSASSRFVYNFGSALRMMGGDAADATAAVNSFESAIDQLRQGRYPFEDLSLAGIDTSGLVTAQNGEEIARQLAAMVPTLNDTQRRVLQENFGLSDATMRLLRQGSSEFDALLARSQQLTGEISGATEAAREFAKQMEEINLRFEGIGNTLAEKMLPSFAKILGSFNKFIDDHEKNIAAATEIASKAPVGAAVAAGGAAAGVTGGALRLIGLGGLGSGISRLGLPGLALGTGMMAWDTKPKDIEGLTGWRPSDYIFENTPHDAARDAYNWVNRRMGMPESEKGSDVFSRLGNWQSDATTQLNDMNSQILSRVNERRTIENQIVLKPEERTINPDYPWLRDGSVSTTEAAQASPSVVQVTAPAAPTPNLRIPPIQNNIDMNVTLNGRAFEATVTDIMERRDQATMDDLTSTTDR